jgi:ABC-2 type transport system ATP-binding protein
MSVAIRVEGLYKSFDDVHAVCGLDIEVRAGECLGLLGPNGAGKTTTIEIIEGLQHADAGQVELLGMPWGRGYDHQLRAQLGIQLQETQLGDKQTVEEVVRLFGSFYPAGRSVDEVIALVDLEPKRKARVHKLSGGQRQRLALACALVGAPAILFLDEPTTGLDPAARLKVWEVVEAFRQGGGTVVLTTHYMEEAAQVCDRVGVMDHGELIAVGTPAELVASLGAEQIIEIYTVPRLGPDELAHLPGVERITARLDALVLSVTDVTTALPAVLGAVEAAGATLENISTHQATLDDVFIHLTGRGLRDD